MPIANLPQALVGKKLMQISDMHVGERFDYNYLIQSLEQAKHYKPDIVVYTGDYITYDDGQQYSQLQKVLKHAVKGTMGTVAILGNHDYGENWSQQSVADEVTTELTDAGIQVLSNQSHNIAGLNIIGLDDYWGRNFAPTQILQEHDPQAANLVLCHNPDVCDLYVWNEYKGWILAGHTHGGQVKPPFLPPPLLPVKNKRYAAGEVDLKDGRTLYINRALGHLHQIRFNVRPEISVFSLNKA